MLLKVYDCVLVSTLKSKVLDAAKVFPSLLNSMLTTLLKGIWTGGFGTKRNASLRG